MSYVRDIEREVSVPRSVNALVHSEASSRTKRSKGTEKNPIPLLLLENKPGVCGRESVGLGGRE